MSRRGQGQHGIGGRGAAGFTLIEALVVVIVIAMLSGILLVAIGGAVRGARVSGQRQTLVALKVAVERFYQEFNFLPPIVNDTQGPLTVGQPYQPRTVSDAYLRLQPQANALPGTPADPAIGNSDSRFSIYSLQYYVMGLLDFPVDGGNGGPIDGVTGPGFTAPQENGAFTRRGRTVPAFMDPTSGGITSRIQRGPLPAGVHEAGGGGNAQFDNARVMLMDRWGQPIRFYRWQPRFTQTGELDQYMVPRVVGNPNQNAELRAARFAIVSTGPDQRTDNGLPFPRAGTGTPTGTSADPLSADAADDIVEVGG